MGGFLGGGFLVPWQPNYISMTTNNCLIYSFGYIEFTDRESVNTAMAMDESLFRARQIKVRCHGDHYLFFHCCYGN